MPMSEPIQLPLMDIDPVYEFPSTRFQGSKRKLVDWIWSHISGLKFDTVLDVFGGTGVVSHLFKGAGKAVTYNDKLLFNWNIGYALIQNSSVTLSSDDIETVLTHHEALNYPQFIQSTFQNIYFTDEENAWLDYVSYNIRQCITDPAKQTLALFALFQSCIIKRPYNLFHRANLYMRSADVERSFGNKVTWDTPFESHFRNFVKQGNAAVFDNGRENVALNLDALDTPIGADLVYLDPPYLNSKGVGVDYRDFYHFLEGLVRYDNWDAMIDYRSRHRRLVPEPSNWNSDKTIYEAFEAVIERHRKSILVISYRDDGIPSKPVLIDLLKRYKSDVREALLTQKYALAKQASHELLLIAE